MLLTTDELDMVRQWYNAVQDLNPDYLEVKDHLLIDKINTTIMYNKRILELEKAPEGLLKQSKETSESMGHNKPNRIFGSDDFTMAWESANEILRGNG